MIPGPANILSCPHCHGEKKVMRLMSGNTGGATVWSDTRRDFPMLPEVSPIQKCPHCNKYYFIEQAKSKKSKADHSFELGLLTYREVVEAYEQFAALSLTGMQRWILNHMLLLAYNDDFRRPAEEEPPQTPTDADRRLYAQVIESLLKGINASPDYELFHAELLRETSRFEEAKEVLLRHTDERDRWIVEAMLRHIDAKDPEPFLLIKDGKQQTP